MEKRCHGVDAKEKLEYLTYLLNFAYPSDITEAVRKLESSFNWIDLANIRESYKESRLTLR